METEKQNEVTFKVAVKTRAVSVYLGRRRFPITLYHGEWLAILNSAADLRSFLEEAKAKGELALRNE